VVDRRRPADERSPTDPPRTSGILAVHSHQDIRDFLVFDGVEEPEESDVVLVTGDVRAVDLRPATPDGPSITVSRERRASPCSKKGFFFES
jgi:hypothetical protein